MIYQDGYRPNVGMVIFNSKGQVLWARRTRQHSWQFPQGGLNENESPEQAMYRELYEELGLRERDIYIAQTSQRWYRYRVPKNCRHVRNDKIYQGQKQRWFLLGLNDEMRLNIEFSNQTHPEFSEWTWVSYWYPLRQVIAFKRDVYRKILTEFAPTALHLKLPQSKNCDGFRLANMYNKPTQARHKKKHKALR